MKGRQRPTSPSDGGIGGLYRMRPMRAKRSKGGGVATGHEAELPYRSLVERVPPRQNLSRRAPGAPMLQATPPEGPEHP
jgi:hypothetical protein